MIERLVDVVNKYGIPVHTYPVTLGKTAPDANFEAKALEAAMYGQLVPAEELPSLTTRMHVSRGGPLEPYGDEVPCLSQTKESLTDDVRTEAHRQWILNGQPEGRADEFWANAHNEMLRARAYMIWQQEGSPDGRADEFWDRALRFERS